MSETDYKESFYQNLLEKYYGKSHGRYKYGVSDITTDDAHIEIKSWFCWKQAIHQLHIYSVQDPRDQLIVCFFGGNFTEEKKQDIRRFFEPRMIVREFKVNNDQITYMDFNTKNIIHTFVTDNNEHDEEKEEDQCEEEEQNIDILKDESGYKCPRCDYKTNRISNLKMHFMRLNRCYDIMLSGVSIESLYTMILNKKQKAKYVCDVCGNGYNSLSGFNYHKGKCGNNQQIHNLLCENKELKMKVDIIQNIVN